MIINVDSGFNSGVSKVVAISIAGCVWIRSTYYVCSMYTHLTIQQIVYSNLFCTVDEVCLWHAAQFKFLFKGTSYPCMCIKFCSIDLYLSSFSRYIQGGAMNRGLPLRARCRRRWRAVSGKISKIRQVDVQAMLYIWGRQWAAVKYDVISLAANSSLKALRGTDLSRRSGWAPAPVGASLLR